MSYTTDTHLPAGHIGDPIPLPERAGIERPAELDAMIRAAS